MRSRSSAINGLISRPGMRGCMTRLIRDSWRRSDRRASSAPGYCTLTATSRPSRQTARCTCPMLAAAAGVSSNSWKRERQPRPNCSASIRCTSAGGIGGAADCSLTSDSRNGAANSSGMAASNTLRAWPNFMAPPLSSPSTSNSCSALFAMSCAEICSPSPPASLRPQPPTARPATPRGRLASFAVRAAVRRGISVTTAPRWRSSPSRLAVLRRMVTSQARSRLNCVPIPLHRARRTAV